MKAFLNASGSSLAAVAFQRCRGKEKSQEIRMPRTVNREAKGRQPLRSIPVTRRILGVQQLRPKKRRQGDSPGKTARQKNGSNKSLALNIAGLVHRSAPASWVIDSLFHSCRIPPNLEMRKWNAPRTELTGLGSIDRRSDKKTIRQ